MENKVKLEKNDDTEEIKFIMPIGPFKAVVLLRTNINVKNVSRVSKKRFRCDHLVFENQGWCLGN